MWENVLNYVDIVAQQLSSLQLLPIHAHLCCYTCITSWLLADNVLLVMTASSTDSPFTKFPSFLKNGHKSTTHLQVACVLITQRGEISICGCVKWHPPHSDSSCFVMMSCNDVTWECPCRSVLDISYHYNRIQFIIILSHCLCVLLSEPISCGFSAFRK